jgi:hypothetical protein
MANQSDKKLALVSVLMTMSNPEDLDRVMWHAQHLLKKRAQQSARRQLTYLTLVEDPKTADTDPIELWPKHGDEVGA